MKTFTKRISALLMVLLLAVTMIPAAAEAAVSAPQSVTVYRTSKTGTSYVDFSVSGLTSKQSIAKSSVKSSNPSVAKPSAVYTSKTNWTRQYFDKTKAQSGNSTYTYISFDAAKSGSSTISYKIGSKTYKTKINVKSYTNPIKTLQMFGLKNGSSTNLAGKLKSTAYASGKLSSTKKNASIKVTAASGWKIRYVSFYNQTTGSSYSYSNYSKPVSSATLYTGTVQKNKNYYVDITMVNTKTNGTISIGYSINQ